MTTEAVLNSPDAHNPLRRPARRCGPFRPADWVKPAGTVDLKAHPRRYHPRQLIQALDFVLANRERFPFAGMVDARFPLERIGEAFARAAERSVPCAAIAA